MTDDISRQNIHPGQDAHRKAHLGQQKSATDLLDMFLSYLLTNIGQQKARACEVTTPHSMSRYVGPGSAYNSPDVSIRKCMESGTLSAMNTLLRLCAVNNLLGYVTALILTTPAD